MAQSKPHTPGTARGAKLAALLVDEGTALVRNKFEEEVKKMNPPSLRKQLGQHKSYFCRLEYLNPGQRKTLYPAHGNSPNTTEGFDISLLKLLWKELVLHELGRNAVELRRIQTYSDKLNRLRRFRNENYGHISSTDLSEAEFDRLWKELTGILVALGGDRDRISERLNSCIDPEQEKKHFDLLEKLYKEDMEVKDLLLAQAQSMKKEILNQGKSLLKGQETLLAQGESQKKEQEEVLDQGKGLLKGQETLLNQGESQKKGQGEVMKGQEAIMAQGESQKKEILDQGESLRKGQEEIKSLLEEVRDAQSPGANFGQHEDSSSSTGLSDVADDVITCLQDLYRTEYAHVRPLPWCEDLNLHLGEIYTNLQLQRRDGKGQFNDTGNIVSLGDIYNPGEDSEVKVKSEDRKIRVEGDPGIGKSCSCQKLAYDWSCGKLDRFKVVFFLEMRHLAGKVKDEIFEQLLPKDTKSTPDQLWSYIQQNQDDVLFILDGLDELSQAARQVTDVVDLIQGKILRNCHVLVTSRPLQCVKDLEKCHQFYKIVGYSKENSEEFIRKYFCESPESASKLVKQLQPEQFLRESYLSQIVVNPLNNLLICVVWEDNNDQLPSSKAELYEMIVLSVTKRFCTKKDLPVEDDKLPPDIEAALRGLGKLSWVGLEQEQLQFNIAQITKKYDKNADNMLNMGLLTRDYSFSRIKRTCLCAFLHKTFQEYMAAWYISGLFTDGSSREEGLKCLRGLFGLRNASDIDRELILNSRLKYREVQDWLLLILGENAAPLFDMFAEELTKAQTDEDRDALSFVCIIWIGKSCAGDKMAEVVAPCLSQHATNNLGDFSERYDVGEFFERYDHHINWIVGLTHVLTCQKKLTASNNPSLTQHLTVDLSHMGVGSSEEEKFDVFEETLSDYDALRSVALVDAAGGSRAAIHTFSPLRTFIPRCGTGSVSIHIDPHCSLYLKLLSSLEQLSVAPRVEHITITCGVTGDPLDDTRDADFSEYDELLAQMIVRQNCLRSLRLEIGEWYRYNHDVRGFGSLTATLQRISQHTTLQEVEFELPVNDVLTVCVDANTNTRFEVVGIVNNMEVVKYRRYERFDVGPMVHELTECIKKNKLLKTLRLRWKTRDIRMRTHKVYHGVCNSRSLSRLCSAIQRNRTLETLEIEGMLTLYKSDSQSGRQARIIAKLLSNKPSNYKVLNITVFAHRPVNDFVTFPAAWVRYRSDRTAAEPRGPST
ncbi:PREDICTED: uncharacterized protein LOC109461987 [Branchiostoma belcheri]|uniref:Uncharacterized protein LOC109461987 n=1 Tax=Branchiostoma belcheri TaxID=7741 RepID=A0A6P4Y5P9_BRABE|nr:PREDICTED: uncharacterized protein LOC109461987 [Branchiostoma belcheri]